MCKFQNNECKSQPSCIVQNTNSSARRVRVFFAQIFLINFCLLSAQDLIRRQDSYNSTFYILAEDTVSGNLYFCKNKFELNGDPTKSKTILYKLVKSVNRLDSVVCPVNTGISAIAAFKNGSLLVLQSEVDSVANKILCKNYINLLDSNLNLQSKVLLDSTSSVPSSTYKLLVHASEVFAITCTLSSVISAKLIRLDANLNILQSKILPGNFIGLNSYGDSIMVLAHDITTNTSSIIQSQLISRDLQDGSLFTYDNAATYSVCNQNISYQFNAGIGALSNNRHIIYGTILLGAQTCFNQKYQTAYSVVGGHAAYIDTKVLSTEDTYNYAPPESSNFVSTSKHGLFAFQIKSPVMPMNPIQPKNYCTKIKVTKIDDLGAIEFATEFGGDKYYMPTAICALSDGGFLLSGMRYDTANPAVSMVVEAFITRFDKFGNEILLGTKKLSKDKECRFKVNQVGDEIKIDADFKVADRIRIMDAAGKIVFDKIGIDLQGPIDLGLDRSGLYVMEMQYQSCFQRSKFVFSY